MPDQKAPFSIPAAPQAFTFAGRALVGFLTGASWAVERRHVVHKFPKRKGQRVEDMERDGRWIQVRLLFIGSTCATDASSFEAFVDQNPFGRLDHPQAGQYNAFCLGPQSAIDFNRALNQIEMNVRFIESELDAQVAVATPDVGTASQNVAAQQTVFQQTVAAYMGALAKAQTQAAGALGSIDSTLNQVQSLASPVSAMQSTVNTALGTASQIAATINLISTQTALLNADVSSFVSAATDLFSGADVNASALADNVANTLGIVTNDAMTLENTLTTPLVTGVNPIGGSAPAGASGAVRDVEFLLDTCLTLNDAVLLQLPATVQYTLPFTLSLIVLSQRLMNLFGITGRDPLVYANSLLGLNRISTPYAIPGGTTLIVPTQ